MQQHNEPCQPPLPQLASFIVTLTIFSHFGWLDETMDLLQRLSRKSRKFVQSAHLAVLRANIAQSKFSQSHGLPNRLVSNRLRRAYSIANLRRDGLCNIVRDDILVSWEHPDSRQLKDVCANVVQRVIRGFQRDKDVTVAMLFREEDYNCQNWIKESAFKYMEFSLHENWTFLVVLYSRSDVDKAKTVCTYLWSLEPLASHVHTGSNS